jgi:hypothetical protein
MTHSSIVHYSLVSVLAHGCRHCGKIDMEFFDPGHRASMPALRPRAASPAAQERFTRQ